MKKSYRVEGMRCGGCSSSVERAIVALAPGAKVEVDLAAAQVTVEGVEDDALVRQAVEDAGFTFAGLA